MVRTRETSSIAKGRRSARGRWAARISISALLITYVGCLLPDVNRNTAPTSDAGTRTSAASTNESRTPTDGGHTTELTDPPALRAGVSGGWATNTAMAGSANPTACVCSATDACCDGCSPINEARNCGTDDLSCTEDTCRGGSCTHSMKADTCLIDGACYSKDQSRPDNQCERCNPSEDARAWSKREAGAPCDDGFYCNGTDHCGQGVHRGECWDHGDIPCSSEDDACRVCDEPSRQCVYATDQTWADADSKLVWQTVGTQRMVEWQAASDACDTLTLCGHSDWHLPTIQELRSTLRNCSATQTAGSCSVTESCLAEMCATAACAGCGSGDHAPAQLSNMGVPVWWSSSARSDASSEVWTVDISQASVQPTNKTARWGGRCVRVNGSP